MSWLVAIAIGAFALAIALCGFAAFFGPDLGGYDRLTERDIHRPGDEPKNGFWEKP